MQHIIEKYQKEIQVKRGILENLKANAELIEKFTDELMQIGFPLKKNGGLKKKAEKVVYDFLDQLSKQNPFYVYRWGSNYVSKNFPAYWFYIEVCYRPEPNNFTYPVIEAKIEEDVLTVTNHTPNLIKKLEQETDPKTVEQNIKTFKEIYEKVKDLPYILRKALW